MHSDGNKESFEICRRIIRLLIFLWRRLQRRKNMCPFS